MNQREARRLVTGRVAAVARALNEFDDFPPDDRRRLVRARDHLAFELESRVGIPSEAPPDPDQEALMTIDYVRTT